MTLNGGAIAQPSAPQVDAREATRQRYMELFGVDPDASDFQRQVWGNFASQAAPQVAMAALPAAGQGLAHFLRTGAGKGLAALAGITGAGLATPEATPQQSQQRNVPSEEVKELQRRLQREGFYTGPIDGVMGGVTRDANEAAERAAARKRQDDLAAKKQDADARKIEADLAETERKRAAEETRALEREQGNQRLQDMERNVGPVQRILRDYGTFAGAGLGLGLGALLRRGIVASSNNAAQQTAHRAAGIVGSPANTPQERVARVNQFWSEGQNPLPFVGARQAPFEWAPGTRAGFRPSPDAPPASALYQPNRIRNAGVDVAIPAVGAAEYGLTHNFLTEPARQRLEDARRRVGDDPSEANINALQAGLDNVAMGEGLENLGRGMFAGYIGATPKFRRSTPSVDTRQAEAEQFSLSQLLRGAGSRPVQRRVVGGSDPTHRWNESAGRWQDSSGRFLAGPPPSSGSE